MRSLAHFLPLLIKAQMPAVPPPPPKTIYTSTDDQADDYADFFGESDGWNDFGGLWIENNDYFVNNYDYISNMEKATDEHNRKNGYVKDPRVPEQPGIIVHPNPSVRVSHNVRVPQLPPGFAYQLIHCVAQPLVKI